MSLDLSSPEFYARVVAEVLAKVAASLVRPAGDQISKLFAKFQEDFSDYLKNTLQLCSIVKTILRADRPVSLSSIYVSTRFDSDETIVEDKELIANLADLKKAVIIGTAGSGKSIFMRYLFIQLFETGVLPIPLYVELKKYNLQDEKDLIKFIFKSIKGERAIVTAEQFSEGLGDGLFTIILDGFDEVEIDRRKDVEEGLLELAKNYPDMILVVSSRPDDCFESWEQFSSFHIAPMNKKQVMELVEKLSFDGEDKRAFIDELNKGLYDRHKTFLSNPLLAILMLQTYSSIHHIPDKLHTFYEAAFHQMFYRRGPGGGPTRTRLSFDDFRLLLSRLSFETFRKGDVSFPAAKLRDIVGKIIQAEKSLGQSVNPDDLIRDLVENFFVLQRDGLFITYSHKSIQEYFAAFYMINKMSIKLMIDYLDRFCHRGEENIIKMAMNMNASLIEREWVLPRVANILSTVCNCKVEDDVIKHIYSLYGGAKVCKITKGDLELHSIILQKSDMFSQVMAIFELYPGQFRPLREYYFRNYRRRDEQIERAMRKLRSDNDPRVRSRTFSVQSRDGDWLRGTWVANYLGRQQRLVVELAASVGGRVRAQGEELDAP